jgi:D-alanyl-D-alanine carboxypeptidase
MNNHAISLKMDKTNYNSVHGLNDALNVSCALDVFRLVEECIKIDSFMEIANTRYFKTYALTD